jgi:hypothetical protein
MRGNKKVFPYVVILKQKNRRSVELVSLIMGLIFVILQIQRIVSNSGSLLVNIPVAVAVSGILVHNISLYRKGKKANMTLFFIVAALTLLLIPPTSMLFIPFLVMAVLYKAATRAQEIGYSEQEIVFSGLVPRKIKWSSLNNVLLKDGILTMDYKDNRLFQKETEDDPEDDDEDATEEEFNAFCVQQLGR